MQIKVRLDKTSQAKLAAFRGKTEQILPALRRASEASALLIEGAAKRLTPVDTGRLRASIATSLGVGALAGGAIVQTNVNYAIYVHEGTKPHFPPLKALEGWAKRHNTTPFQVARGIARKGIKKRPFMRQAVEQEQGKIGKIFSRELDNTLKV